MDLEELQAVYSGHHHLFVALAGNMEDWLRGVILPLALHEPRVSGRAKTVHSLVMKQVLKPREDPMSQVSDKVGVRVDVAYLADVDRVVEAICQDGDVEVIGEPDRKLDQFDDDTKPSVLVYPGVNIDVRPQAVPDGIAPEWATCEVQVRTLAQSAWSVAGHDLTYKPPEGITVPWRLRRQVQRLLALLEIYDETMNDVRQEVLSDHGYAAAIVVHALRGLWVRFSVAPGSEPMTWAIVGALTSDLNGEEGTRLAAELARFVDAEEEKIRLVIEQHPGLPMLQQPEALLIFHMIDRGPRDFARRWAAMDHVPWQWGEDLATAWGKDLRPPLR